MSAAAGRQRPDTRRPFAPRLVTTLALFVLSAALFSVIFGYAMVRQADDRQGLERRAALLGAIEDWRSSGADLSAPDPQFVRAIERTAGLRNLRFEATTDGAGRDLQSVLDRRGRIVGWFSWEPDRALGHVLDRLKPLLAFTGMLLVGFALLVLWQVRKAVRDLGESERRGWALAHKDMLTGLPNHRRMLGLIDDALAAPKSERTIALALIDLDGLKDVNDAHGHAAGDEFLVAFARRLTEAMAAGAVCGRFDGDEFAVIAEVPDAEAATRTMHALAEALAKPFWIKDQALRVGVTVGHACAPGDARTRDELISRAGIALRAAKRKQRGSVLAFQPALNAEYDQRAFLERELRRALAARAFDLHYQPIVSADGARIVGAEALLRWNHPVRGEIAPTEFVPAAERCGLAGELGALVLRRALADARRWPGLYVAVNLSPVQVRDPALVELVADTLADNRLPASRLVLEVTEGVLIDDPDEAKARLDALSGLGVRLALDDFGTGYSSLTYLQRFRFDKLKIDRGFVAPLGRDPRSQALVQAIVALGRALDLRLLAEGVETEAQRVLLRLAGCHEMQGFLFARPAPRAILDRLMEDASAWRPSVQAAVA